MQSRISYYGYGYSILLIPLFKLCQSGIELIKSAVLINIFLVVGTYLLQIKVMSKICDKCNLITIAFIAFILSLYPYSVSNAMWVFCECFLSFQFWLIADLLHETIKKKRKKYYIFLAIATAFITFIHIRAFVVVLVIILIVVSRYLWEKESEKKNVLIFLVFFSLSLIAFYSIKRHLYSMAYMVEDRGINQVNNIITVQYIFDRFRWLLAKENIRLYMVSFFSKIFYLIVSSVGLLPFGFWVLVQKLIKKRNIKTTTDAKEYVEIYFLLTFVLMFIVCCLNGTGVRDDFASFFYGRYYEYLVAPLIFLGLYSCLYCGYKLKNYAFIWAIFIISGLGAQNLILYLDSDEIHIDPARCSGFSFGIEKNDNFLNLISFLLAYISLIVIFIVILQSRKVGKIIIPILVLCIFLKNDYLCLNYNKKVNELLKSDVDIATYLSEHVFEENIYFIQKHGDKEMFSRIQVLIKNRPIIIVNPDKFAKIEEGAYIITNSKAQIMEEENLSDTYIMESKSYELYRK